MEKLDRSPKDEKNGYKNSEGITTEVPTPVSPGFSREGAPLVLGFESKGEKILVKGGPGAGGSMEGSGQRGLGGKDHGSSGKAGSVGSFAMKGQGNSAYWMSARMRIEQAKRYPREAIRKKWEGKVVLSFQIDQRGEVGEINIVRSQAVGCWMKKEWQPSPGLPLFPHRPHWRKKNCKCKSLSCSGSIEKTEEEGE